MNLLSIRMIGPTFALMLSSVTLAAAPHGSYKISCHMHDQTSITTNWKLAEKSGFPVAAEDVRIAAPLVKRIGNKVLMTEVYDDGVNYNTSFQSHIKDGKLGLGQTNIINLIPVLSERSWNILVPTNTYQYYELNIEGSQTPSVAQILRDGVLNQTYAGLPDFLQVGAPFLEIKQEGTADGKALVIHLQAKEGYMKGTGFLLDSNYYPKEDFIEEGHLIPVRRSDFFPCEVVSLKIED